MEKTKNTKYADLNTEELLKKQKKVKYLTIAIIIIFLLSVGTGIYLLFQEDKYEQLANFLIMIPVLGFFIASPIDKKRAAIKDELESRGEK